MKAYQRHNITDKIARSNIKQLSRIKSEALNLIVKQIKNIDYVVWNQHIKREVSIFHVVVHLYGHSWSISNIQQERQDSKLQQWWYPSSQCRVGLPVTDLLGRKQKREGQQ